MSALEKLLSIASPALSTAGQPLDRAYFEPYGDLGRELHALLTQRNGFFAFESALHVLPFGDEAPPPTLQSWNDNSCWKYEYGTLLPGAMLCFAQDAFGNQFCLHDGTVGLCEVETAKVERLADTLAEWAPRSPADWRGLTEFELAHEWQIANRPLGPGERLIPKIPFVIGGKYEVANLYAGQIVAAMRFRGDFARQIADLPDGSRVTLKVIPPSSKLS